MSDNELNKYFDADGQPTAALTSDEIFTACTLILASTVRLHDAVTAQLKELRELGARIAVRLADS